MKFTVSKGNRLPAKLATRDVIAHVLLADDSGAQVAAACQVKTTKNVH